METKRKKIENKKYKGHSNSCDCLSFFFINNVLTVYNKIEPLEEDRDIGLINRSVKIFWEDNTEDTIVIDVKLVRNELFNSYYKS